jgi:hypothetical protein
MPAAVLADGMVFRPIAVAANVSIPDQRALIHFTNGVERLVIETRFTGEGTNFAWVVPLPSQPVIEEATTGLFPTLQYLFRPRITHNVTRYYFGILILIGIVALLRLSGRSVFDMVVYALLLLLFLFFAAALLPIAGGLSKAGISASVNQEVSVLDRKIVGVFETATIASPDAHALQSWLTENGFAVPTNSEPIIASYIKDGWVFVAAKLNRDNPTNATSTPHPLSFTFKTDKPVYPMRLTGLNSDSLKVELYVFGSERATAKHFKVERCTRPNYPEKPKAWSRGRPATLDIVHPLLRQWMDGAPVATKLTATLSRADMRQDIEINWRSFAEKKNDLFSRAGARTIALNWASGIFALGLLAVWIFVSIEKKQKKFPQWSGIVTIVSVAIAGLVYLALPKTEVRLLRGSPMSEAYHNLFWPAFTLSDHPGLNSAEARALLDRTSKEILATPQQSSERRYWENVLLGGPIHFEDSPGNYTLRDTTNGLEFLMHDAQGAEQVFDRWRR